MRRRLLVIDDDPSVCEFLQDRLEAMGYAVLVAHDGPTGLAIMRLEEKHAPIQGVLLDVHMPVMDGMQVLQRLTMEHEGVPVVVVSGDPDNRIRDEALRLGARRHIIKPVDTNVFRQICEDIFPIMGSR